MRWVIIGMHRSGTSLLMKLFERAGFYLGEPADFHPPSEHDPEGYRERIDVWALNEEALATSGASWDRPQRFALEKLGDGKVGDVAGSARVVIERLDQRTRAAGAPGCALKDPRLSLTLDLWRPALDEPPLSRDTSGQPTRYVLLARDPLAVARSFAARDRMPIDVGLALWEAYFRAAARQLRPGEGTVLHHAELLRDPAAAWHRLFATSGLATPPLESPEALIRDSLHRERPAAEESDAWLWPALRRLREQVTAGAVRDVEPELSPPAHAKLEDWAARASSTPEVVGDA